MVGNPYLTRIMEGLPVIQEEQFTDRSEEHTSELRHGYISYAAFCLKKELSSSPRASRSPRATSCTLNITTMRLPSRLSSPWWGSSTPVVRSWITCCRDWSA